MSEWSDWYLREDPTEWVLPTILRRRAEEHPDRDYLRVSGGPVARIRRGQRAGQPGGQRPHRPRPGPGRGRLHADAERRGELLGLVRDPEGGRRPVADQPRLPGRLPVVGAQPAALALPGDRPGPPGPPGADRRRAALPGARGGGARGRARGTRPAGALGDVRGVRRRARLRAGGRGHVDRRRPDHVHLRDDRALEGRDQAAGLGLLLGPHLQRGLRGHGGRHVLLVPAPVPLQRAGAGDLPGDDRRRAGGLRRALLVLAVLEPGDRGRRDDLQHGQRDQLLHLEHAPGRAGPRPPGDARHGHAGAQGHLRAVRGALRRALHRGLRPDRDRDGHVPPAPPQPAPGQLRAGDPRVRGLDRAAGHRPAAAPGHARARSWWT